MAEKSIFFESQGLKIEVLIHESPGQAVVFGTQPHPLYGGDMSNNVFEALVQAYQEKGYTTLRFNFRGAGRSGGSYDEGAGEQEDVRAALTYLHDLGKSSCDLAGYSFGAWVNALGLKGLDQAGRMIMVSPPVNFMDFSSLDYSSKIRLVVAGSEDEIAPPASIQEILPSWNPDAVLEIIQGADHFYWGKTGDLKGVVRGFLDASE